MSDSPIVIFEATTPGLLPELRQENDLQLIKAILKGRVNLILVGP